MRKQRDVAGELGLSGSYFNMIIKGYKRPGKNKAAYLEDKSGIGRMVWLYGTLDQLIENIEATYGTFKR